VGYFWLNQREDYQGYGDVEGEVYNYRSNVPGHRKLSAGDRFVYYRPGEYVIFGGGTIGKIKTETADSEEEGGGLTEFFGVENTDGPAPRAMPQIPLEVDDEGFVRGLFPEEPMQMGGIEYIPEWFQYCGVQTYPGVQPDVDQDNYFRYAEGPPEALSWQTEVAEPGDRVNVEHFEDYDTWGNGIGEDGIGKPARVTWRSEGLSPQETMIVEVIRSTRIEEMAQDNDWISESTEQGFIAYLDKCTHFCCVPGFKGIEGAEKFGAADEVYCPCHQSIYDPFSIVRKSFVALPRPEGN